MSQGEAISNPYREHIDTQLARIFSGCELGMSGPGMMRAVDGRVENSDANVAEFIDEERHLIVLAIFGGLRNILNYGSSFTRIAERYFNYEPKRNRLQAHVVSLPVAHTDRPLEQPDTAKDDLSVDVIHQRLVELGSLEALQQEHDLGLHETALDDWDSFATTLERFVPGAGSHGQA